MVRHGATPCGYDMGLRHVTAWYGMGLHHVATTWGYGTGLRHGATGNEPGHWSSSGDFSFAIIVTKGAPFTGGKSFLYDHDADQKQ